MFKACTVDASGTSFALLTNKSIYWLSPEMVFPPSHQSLMSWDSDILASVFLTRRAVSLDAGL